MRPPSEPLADLLSEEIASHGPMTFRDFMELALYHPELGYYRSGRARIGRGGDFITSVSVGPLFGKLLARQFVEMWERLEKPPSFTIVEQGADRGEFACDALAALAALAPECFAATTYRIVEPAPRSEAAQRERLTPFRDRVQWHASLETLSPITGLFFSNELLDAFPVHRVKWIGAEWIEQRVTERDGAFCFVDAPIGEGELREHLQKLPVLPDGYETEVNLEALRWVAAIAGRLERGYVLALDYGFSRDEMYRPERAGGTLSAYAAHRREPDPLARPGEIDITAHVDFTSLAERAEVRGLPLIGWTDQHHLMVGLSRLHFRDQLAPDAAAQRELRAFQTLMHPGFLGQSFTALCLGKNVSAAPPLAGFTFASDARRALGLPESA
ncbi:MAG: hypothetical protein JWQ44_1525 [Chthoniobacter sp.]|nr:hypothetical protein [Chthoniobacter sp.]